MLIGATEEIKSHAGGADIGQSRRTARRAVVRFGSAAIGPRFQ
jgi:hypothetical protein